MSEKLLREIENWRETAQRHAGNEDFYRRIVVETGKLLGPEAYISDDGSVQQDILCAKVFELVKKRLEARQPPALDVLREALEKIAADSRDTRDPELSSDNSQGNYDDVFQDGARQQSYWSASIARAALSAAPAKDGERP